MEEKVLKTILKYNLIENGDKLILGVSGGPDSIAMLNILDDIRNNEEIKLNFEKVDIGFSSNENIHLITKTKTNLKSETTFVNTAKVFGEFQGYKVNDKSSWKTLVYKLLPKTGF